MKPSTISRSAAACAAAVLLAACASSSSSSGSSSGASTSSGPVTYGVLSCFTGRLASLGQAMLQGSQVAVSEINSAGGVLGRKLQLVTGDTSCDVADGVTATNQMLTKNVSGVIGPETQEINGVEPILDANHIVDEFQGGDTARDHQMDPYFFRDSPSDSQLGVAMSLYGHLQGYTKAVMLFYSDPAAQTFLKPVSQTFTKLGGTILKTIIVTPDQTSYLSQVREAIAAHPQVIFTQEDPPTAAVLFREFGQLGGGSIPWIGTDVTSGSDFLKAITYPVAHAVLTSVYGTSVTGTANTAFINLFNQLFPSQKAAGPLANANYAYDAVISLALADDYAKTTNGTTVAHDMTKVTNPPGTACYTYAACLALIKAGTKINYEGASGDLDYNQYNNTFGPYGAFKATAAGLEQQAYVMSASALAAATP
ncbi:MAG TPA: ABC transporter substrate-binding protein [Streptosporangiaceae bacterium]|nr:ABC transporter substrate-binding protein [Streptosporangiaceae bacterium]